MRPQSKCRCTFVRICGDTVAAGVIAVAHAGFTGIAMGFVNYLTEFPYFRDEVIPRLERAGVRLQAGR
jgi:alkanesulfonate monooxygenase SsuD/methylene tetrahydromethanopterin reductase-like flavin-dependent oxidoreductase (luciferase family)